MLNDSEIQLIGKWIFEDGKIVNDSISERVIWLINNYLVKICQDKSGWSVLYKDPQT
jgi:hypothetical protein